MVAEAFAVAGEQATVFAGEAGTAAAAAGAEAATEGSTADGLPSTTLPPHLA